MQEIQGDELRTILDKETKAHTHGINEVLSPYEPTDATRKWHATIRAIEEFVNLLTMEIDELDFVNELASIKLDAELLKNPVDLDPALDTLSKLYDQNVARRFGSTVLRSAAMNISFAAHGFQSFGYGLNLKTVGGAVDYYQSRRRHMVTLLYMMPGACKGEKPVPDIDTLNVFLPVIELNCIALTSLYQNAFLADLYPQFSAWSDGRGMVCSHNFQPLEKFFFEPERVSLLDMFELRGEKAKNVNLEETKTRRVFCTAEVRNSVRLINASYTEFDLDQTEFRGVSEAISDFTHYCRDDYYIVMHKERLRQILKRRQPLSADKLENLLVNRSTDFATNTNSFKPFIEIGDQVESNVNFLTRFLNHYKNVCLGKSRKYQVHSGFIFEDRMKRDLSDLGFHVTDIKRINRKEFDVVATADDTIYNIQCKNNEIDLSKVETQRAVFARYNRYLLSYYRRALAKEEAREHLLLAELGHSKILHFVVSRFPVISDQSNIIPYNSIEQLVPRQRS